MEVKEKIRNDIDKYGFVIFSFSDEKSGDNIELVAFHDFRVACAVYDNQGSFFPQGQLLKIEYVPYLDLKNAAFADNCTGFGIASAAGYLFRAGKEQLDGQKGKKC